MAALGLHDATRPAAPAARLALALTALLMAGCARGRMYDAKKLPTEFIIPPKDNAQTLDLSRLMNSAVSSELIDRGDVLEVTIETGYGTDKPTTSPVRVGEDGFAMIPLIGKVAVAGLETDAAEQVIAAAAVERGLYRNPNVTAVMKRQRTNRITVVGGVDKPGAYDLPRGSCTLLAAIVEAGGFSKKAGTDVEIRRTARAAPGEAENAGPAMGQGSTAAADDRGVQPAGFRQKVAGGQGATSIHINMTEAAKQGANAHYLNDGDVVMVEVRDAQPVHVIGLVNHPTQIDLPANQDLRVLDAISQAGGLTTNWADKVHVIRHVPAQETPIVVDISLREAKAEGQGNLRLGAGDVVSVEQTPMTVLVSALGNFAHFTMASSVPLIK